MTDLSRKIAVMTGTRADYGLLRPLIAELSAASEGDNPAVELQLIVTGTHLAEAYGRTIEEIVRDGFHPAAEVDIWGAEPTKDLLGEEGSASLTAAVETGEAVAKFSLILNHLKPDVVVVLGDRLEAFAMAAAATILLIPVAHIHGGELTLGAMDDSLRHAITKLSYLHFTTTDEHRDRVLQLGEEPARVFNFGAPVLDAIESLQLLGREELEHKFGIRFGHKNILMTFHPAAFDVASAKFMIEELLAAMEAVSVSGAVAGAAEADSSAGSSNQHVQLIITGTNNDIGSDEVRAAISAFAAAHPDHVSYVESFGQLGYLSAMREVDVVTGNSSSTVLEAPIFGKPSVLVGNRQEGRPMGAGVIKVDGSSGIFNRNEILAGLQKALTPEFAALAAAAPSPFGTAGFAKKAAELLTMFDLPSPPKKSFQDQA
jgi:UDP-hydrolysing UDP-N-acetyl-D-glucosamine 2-epimerase